MLKQKLAATTKTVPLRKETKCTRCGEALAVKGAFCQECASQLCPACGRVYLSDSIFCSNCGRRRCKPSELESDEAAKSIEGLQAEPELESTRPVQFHGAIGSTAYIAHIRRLKAPKLPDPGTFDAVAHLLGVQTWKQQFALLAEMRELAQQNGNHNLSICDAFTRKLLWRFTAFGHESIAQIQDLLVQKLQRPVANLELIFQGQRLERAVTIFAAGVRQGDCLHAELSPSMMLTASRDGTAKVWNLESDSLAVTLTNRRYMRVHNDCIAVTAGAASTDGLSIATGSDDGLATLWSAEDGMSMVALPTHSRAVTSVAFSTDDRWVATASLDCTAKISSATTGTCLYSLEEHSDAVRSVAFSIEGWFLTASDDCTAKIWDPRRGRCTVTIEGHKDIVMAAAYSPGCLSIATGSQDKTTRIWNAMNGKSIKVCRGHAGTVTSVVYSRDGKMLATGSIDKSAKLWDAEGECLHTLAAHAAVITSVAFSLDGRCIALGSSDSSASVWEVRSGKLVRKMQGIHQDEVTAVMFTSPPGWNALSACARSASALSSRHLNAEIPLLWPSLLPIPAADLNVRDILD